MENQQKIPAGIYYVIPSQVFEDTALEHSEVVFYGLISGLSFSSGYCFASDEYLGERMRVDGRTIRRWLEKLEGLSYIKRETIKKGMYWERKIFITHSRIISNNVYERTPMSASSGPPRPHRKDAHVRIEGEEELVSEDPPLTPPKKTLELSLPTKEEEEEIDRRIRERPKDSPKIKCMKKYRSTVLEEIRSEKKDNEAMNLIILKRRLLAEGWDGKKFNGKHVSSHREFVEFSLGAFCRQVRYDVPQEEWIELTGLE